MIWRLNVTTCACEASCTDGRRRWTGAGLTNNDQCDTTAGMKREPGHRTILAKQRVTQMVDDRQQVRRPDRATGPGDTSLSVVFENELRRPSRIVEDVKRSLATNDSVGAGGVNYENVGMRFLAAVRVRSALRGSAATSSSTRWRTPRRCQPLEVDAIAAADVGLEHLVQRPREVAVVGSRRCSLRCARTTGCRSWWCPPSPTAESTTIVLWWSMVRLNSRISMPARSSGPNSRTLFWRASQLSLWMPDDHDPHVDAAPLGFDQRVDRGRIRQEVRVGDVDRARARR